MEKEDEVYFTCPHCWQKISMVLEATVSQSYIEDCEVCCQPIQISYKVVEGEICDLQALTLDA